MTEQQIKLFPKIDLDNPVEEWQKQHRNLFVHACSCYEWLILDLERAGFIRGNVLKSKKTDFDKVAIAGLTTTAFRRFFRLIDAGWSGDGETALILTRALFDLAVSALLIRQDQQNGELFVKFNVIQGRKVLTAWGAHFRPSLGPDEKKEEHDLYYKEFAPLFTADGKVRDSWHPKWRISDRAALVGLKEHYELGFSRYAEVSHGGPGNLFDYCKASENEGLEFSLGPNGKDIGEALTEGAKYLCIIFAAFADLNQVQDLSKAVLGSKESILKHEDYQTCIQKNPWLKDWLTKK